MPILNELGDTEYKLAERLTGWTLSILGYSVGLGMMINAAGWKDPVFRIVAEIPDTPYSWAGALLIATLIFNIGWTRKHENHWRGRTIIVGAILVAAWWLGMCFAMTREVYEMPTRITIMWPLVCFGIACMYLTRVVAYSDMFTGDRWNTNPFQTWGTTFLMMASLSQVIIGISPVSVLTEIERPAALTVGGANLFGAIITMFGLHLKDKEQGILYEMAGSATLVLTLGWYCAAVLHQTPLAGVTLGFAMPEAFVFATLHRTFQTLSLQWARWSGRPHLERRMIHALNPTARRPTMDPEVPPNPPIPVLDEAEVGEDGRQR